MSKRGTPIMDSEFKPLSSKRGQHQYSSFQHQCKMKIMWTAEIQILNEDMIIAVVIFIFYIFIVTTYFLQLHWYFKWRCDHRSGNGNWSNFANKPEKISGLQQDSNLWLKFWRPNFFRVYLWLLKLQSPLWWSHLDLKYQCIWRKQVTIMITKGKMFDLWSNSFKLLFEEMYGY